jgi:hypothetical protein
MEMPPEREAPLAPNPLPPPDLPANAMRRPWLEIHDEKAEMLQVQAQPFIEMTELRKDRQFDEQLHVINNQHRVRNSKIKYSVKFD